MFGYRARIGYISPSVIELNAYDDRIVPEGVGLIGVACMVGGWLYVAFRAVGMREKINGYGRLLRML